MNRNMTVLAILLIGCSGVVRANDAVGFVSLRNGQYLPGWQLCRADPQWLVFEHGRAGRPASGGQFQFSKGQYNDFQRRFEFRGLLVKTVSFSESRVARELRRFPAAEAHQGVAVDGNHVYAITNRAIGKYDKQTGQRVAGWSAGPDSSLRHLNSGVVVGEKLYCAHSNWPATPLKNSIEVFATASLRPVGNHSFDKLTGALTWIDRFGDHWWVGVAFYGDAKSVQRTTVHKLDDQWRMLGSWTFPRGVVQRFVPFSNSGASFGPDGLLYATGHDRGEAYSLRVPDDGPQLVLVDTVPLKIAGQGIAWDRHDQGVLYGIHRASKHVVVSKFSQPVE